MTAKHADARQPMVWDPGPTLLTMPEAAAHLRISRSTLYPLVMSGQIASLTIGRRRFVTAAELARYVAAQGERP